MDSQRLMKLSKALARALRDQPERVGARRGKPIVLRIDARRMAADGHAFTRSDNGV